MSAIRKKIAVAKAPKIIEHIESMLESGIEKIILFAHHHELIDILKNHFRSISVSIDGRTPNEKRVNAVDSFQTDSSVKLFIGAIRACGEGITLHASSHVVFAEQDFVPGRLNQAEDRAHRIGQKNNVLVQHLVVDGSLDAYLIKMVVNKQNVADSALDNNHEPLPVVELTPKPSTPAISPPKKSNGSNGHIPDNVKSALLEALQSLAGMCDGAYTRDDSGFNRFDSKFGKSLAMNSELTDKQALAAKKMLRKYKRQINSDIYELIYLSTY
jgi:hypothetical protein